MDARGGGRRWYSTNPFATRNTMRSDHHHAPAALPPGKIHRTGGRVGTGAGLERTENLPLAGIRFPDRPVRREFLPRLQHHSSAEVCVCVCE